MSRIRLEWNVETETIDKSDGEDPIAKRARRRRALRLMLLIGIFLTLLAFAGLVLRQRFLDVQGQLEQLLRETVHAETAALRIGDIHSFLAVQDSTSEAWRQRQQSVFSEYSELKARHDVDLTGAILDLEMDGQRGRVVIEEIIDGVRYAQVWFYRNLGESWYHSAPDYSFWGEERTFETDVMSIHYFALDEPFAQALSKSVGAWIERGCQILQCDFKPEIVISLVNDSAQPASGTRDRMATFRVLSPSSGRASLDSPFDQNAQALVAEALADHLVSLRAGGRQVVYPHDAVYMRLSLVSYLVKQFLGAEDGDSHSLVDSLAAVYGEEKVAELVDHLAPSASVSVLEQIIGQALDEAPLDWRGFVKWRLDTEADLIESGAESDMLNLYDTGDEDARQAAIQRYQTKTMYRPGAILDQTIERAPDGRPRLRVTVRAEVGANDEEIVALFNLVDGVWKRAN